MAITATAFEVVRVYEQIETEESIYNADRQGKVFYVDPTTGKALLADAGAAANYGASATIGAILGVASVKERSTLAGNSVTLLTEAEVFLGAGVLSALAFGAPVYLSDTDGVFAETAGTVEVQIGYVIPAAPRDGTGIDKLLRISTSHLATFIVHPEAP